MKRILATIALAALTLSSCMKEDNTWKEMQPVLPGTTIYQFTMNQNMLAMQPANVGMRVAMLVAEALAQDSEADLSALGSVTVDKLNVLSALFNDRTTIARLSDGNFRVTFSENSQMPDGLYLKGSMLVTTNGTNLLADGGTWEVNMEDVEAKAVSTSTTTGGTETMTIIFDDGSTSITGNGNGSFSIRVSGFQSHIKDQNFVSNWNGYFDLTAPDASLTYTACHGKKFDVEGRASGPKTIYSGDGTEDLSMSYKLEDGVYIGLQIVEGVQTCEFPNPFQYNATAIPYSTVYYTWTYNETDRRTSYQIQYGPYIYPKK